MFYQPELSLLVSLLWSELKDKTAFGPASTDKILDVVKYTLSTAASIAIFLVLSEKIGQ